MSKNHGELSRKEEMKREVVVYSVPGGFPSEAGAGVSGASGFARYPATQLNQGLQGQREWGMRDAYKNRVQICWRAVTFQKCN